MPTQCLKLMLRGGLPALWLALTVGTGLAQTDASDVAGKTAPTAAAAVGATNAPVAAEKPTGSPAPGPTGRSRLAPTTAAAPAAPTALNFEAFKVVAERNIFDQGREKRVRGVPTTVRVAPTIVEAFGLVGTMSYEKGTFAFFDGSSSQYQKALKVGESIGTYKLTEVTNDQVKLSANDKEVALKLGQKLSREKEGEWSVSANIGGFGGASSSDGFGGGGGSSGNGGGFGESRGFNRDSGGGFNRDNGGGFGRTRGGGRNFGGNDNSTAAPAPSAPSSSAAPAATDSSEVRAATSEVLRRLMQQRERETQ